MSSTLTAPDRGATTRTGTTGPTRPPEERPSDAPAAVSGLPAVLPLRDRAGRRIGLPGVSWVSSAVDAYSALFVPIDGGTIGFAVFLLILGGALARRKQAGWVLAMVIFSFSLLGDLVVVVGLLGATVTGQVDYASLPGLARFAFNLAALGALTACMVVYRGEFTARRQPGSARKALLTLLAGTLVTFGVAMALVSVFPNELVGPRGRMAWIVQRFITFVLGGDGDLVPQPLAGPPSWISTVVGLLAGLTLLAAMVALTRSQRQASGMSAGRRAESPRPGRRVRGGLARLLRHPPGQVGGLRRERPVGDHLPGRPRRLPGQQRPDRAAGSLGWCATLVYLE